MRLYTTTIKAIDPLTGETKGWCGPYVPGISFEDAWRHCQQNGLGYCRVDGELIAEIPTKEDGITPDFGKIEDYDIIQNN